MDTNASDRLLRIAAVTKKATDVLGSRVAAEHWLATPAIGLDQCRPVDLLQRAEGLELVITLLARMDRGVYT
ncbi:putative toxin-antitoxin system antitoxin component (TIGR02293 family) [Caballeronia udeis]|uniref:Toxin-antitoxin system antitoxin component (TIGR02293 family) n=1 Tax=Caballeronia udeis TaxID=1232866 RepID=A0ABW8MZ05_9BURK